MLDILILSCQTCTGEHTLESASALGTGTVIHRILSAKEKWPGTVTRLTTFEDKVLAEIEWFDGSEKLTIVLAGLQSYARPPARATKHMHNTQVHTHNTRVHFSPSPLPYHLLGDGASKWEVLDESTYVITYLGKSSAVKLFLGPDPALIRALRSVRVRVRVYMCEFARFAVAFETLATCHVLMH